VSRKTLSFMEFVPGPGLCADPGLALPEKGLQTLCRGLAAEVAGYEVLNAFSDYGVDGCLPSKSQATGFLKELFIDFKCNIGHFGAPDKRFKEKLAQALCHVKATRTAASKILTLYSNPGKGLNVI
jgi:hypothetical protein